MYRAMASGIKPHGVMINSIQLHSAMKYEKVHPQQCGYLRRKVRTQRRPTMPRENPFVFYPKLVIESVVKYTAIGLYAFNVNRLRKRIQRDPASKAYTDLALTPVNESAEEDLEMFDLNDSARAVVVKARGQAEARAKQHAKTEAAEIVAAE